MFLMMLSIKPDPLYNSIDIAIASLYVTVMLEVSLTQASQRSASSTLPKFLCSSASPN